MKKVPRGNAEQQSRMDGSELETMIRWRSLKTASLGSNRKSGCSFRQASAEASHVSAFVLRKSQSCKVMAGGEDETSRWLSNGLPKA